jgi:hypothetical protein
VIIIFSRWTLLHRVDPTLCTANFCRFWSISCYTLPLQAAPFHVSSFYTQDRGQMLCRKSNSSYLRHTDWVSCSSFLRPQGARSLPREVVGSNEGVSKSFRTGRLERELQMVQLSATGCSCIATLWVSLVSFAAITLSVASQRVFIVVYFVIDSVRKLLDTHSYSEWKWPSYFIGLL